MKTALLIENGLTQVVLTPESDFEKDVLRRFLGARSIEPWLHDERPVKVHIYRGSFFECRGGWTRYQPDGDESLILRVLPEAQEPESIPIKIPG